MTAAASPRRKQDLLLTIGSWALAVLFGWFVYEAREIKEAVYRGQRDQAELSARMVGVENRVNRIESQIDTLRVPR